MKGITKTTNTHEWLSKIHLIHEIGDNYVYSGQMADINSLDMSGSMRNML